jgi:hypothetical protein
MTSRIIASAFLALTCSTSSFAQPRLHSNAHIGFAYPISTNGTHAAEYSNSFSLHAISGVSAAEQSVCISGIASIIKDSATGFVASGIANVIGNSAIGVQFAGFVNSTRNHSTGAQAAGFANVTGGMLGAQMAGFANIATGNVVGVQAAGFFNRSRNVTCQAAGFANIADSTRAQFAGFANVAKDVYGVQASGFANVSEHGNGLQAAGFANVSGDVEGAQLAGFINVAGKVKGIQAAGFLNIADSSEYPIGIINIIGNGEKALGVMVDENGTTFATFRSGSRKLYGIVGAGYNWLNNKSVYASVAGIGAHLPVSRAFHLSVESNFTTLMDFKGTVDWQSGIKALPSLRFGSVELFAGPSFNYASSSRPGAAFDHHSVWTTTSYCRIHELYFGGVAGVQFHF